MGICHGYQRIYYYQAKTLEIYHQHQNIQTLPILNKLSIHLSFLFSLFFVLPLFALLIIISYFLLLCMFYALYLQLYANVLIDVGQIIEMQDQYSKLVLIDRIYAILLGLLTYALYIFIIFLVNKQMKFTHNAVTSIMVEKVQNITTSMTRAGLGDDTYRRQRQKQRYLKCKQQQAQKQQKMREEFLNKRNQKLKEAEQLTQKRHAKRQKKKQRQRQLKKKMKFIQKLDKGNNAKQIQSGSDNQQQQQNSVPVVVQSQQQQQQQEQQQQQRRVQQLIQQLNQQNKKEQQVKQA